MSKANRIALQQFLIGKGADLGPWGADGQVGPATTRALYTLFANRSAPKASTEQITGIARSLGASFKQLAAFAKVESGGSGFQDTGHPKILWERHYFWKRLRVVIPWISNPKPGDYTLDKNRNGTNDSWEKLLLGCARDPVAAFESCSWGKFQIMGAHWKSLGYASVFEFAWSMCQSEMGHYEAFARFIRRDGLAPLLRKVSMNPADNVPLVKRYNGPAYAKNNYHVRIAEAMR